MHQSAQCLGKLNSWRVDSTTPAACWITSCLLIAVGRSNTWAGLHVIPGTGAAALALLRRHMRLCPPLSLPADAWLQVAQPRRRPPHPNHLRGSSHHLRSPRPAPTCLTPISVSVSPRYCLILSKWRSRRPGGEGAGTRNERRGQQSVGRDSLRFKAQVVQAACG